MKYAPTTLIAFAVCSMVSHAAYNVVYTPSLDANGNAVLYAPPGGGPTPGGNLVLYYDFADATQATNGSYIDQSGNGRNATQENASAVGVWTNYGGGCLYLDGVDDFVDASAYADTARTLSNVTLTIWFNQQSQSAQGRLLDLQHTNIVDNAGSDNCSIDFRHRAANNDFQYYFFSNNTGLVFGNTADFRPTFQDNWNHFAVCWANGTNFLFTNGVACNLTMLQGSQSAANKGWKDCYRAGYEPRFLGFGVNANRSGGALNSWFKGWVDEVRVYSDELTAAEIKAVYDEGR